jgi:hypothetical protein
VSAATPRFDEHRIELGATATTRAAETDASLSYTHSAENDWQSHAISAALSRDLAHKNAKLSLAYGYTRNRVGRAGDPSFEKALAVHGADVGLAQIVDRKTLATLSYTISHASGYQGSPYRFIMTEGFAAPEVTPETRLRHAITARVLRALGRRSSIDGSYRFYLDDWGIRSHTVEVAYTRELGEAVSLRVRARGYRQNRADFYQETYAMPMRYMTVDRELSTFWDAAGGVKLGWKGERFELSGKVDGILYKFEDYARLRGRVALVTGLGATWSW